MRQIANVWLRSEDPALEQLLYDFAVEIEGGLVQDIVRWRGRWRFSHQHVSESPEGKLERWLVFTDKGPEESAKVEGKQDSEPP